MTDSDPDQAGPPASGGRIARLRARVWSGGWVQGVIETLSVRVGLIVVGLGGSIVLARLLGPEGRGELYLAMMLATLGSTVLNLGIHASNTYTVSRDRSTVGTTTANSLVFALATGALVGALVLAVGLLGSVELPLEGWLLVLVVVALPLQVAYLQLHPLLVVIDELRKYNLLEIAQRASGLVVVAMLWAVGGVNPSAVFAGTTVVLLVSVGWVANRLRLAAPDRSMSPSVTEFRAGLPYARRAYVGGMAALLLLRIDVVLIDAELGAVAVGLYSIAASVGDLVQLIPSTVGGLLFPRLSAMDDGRARWTLALRCAVAVGVVLMLGCSLVFIVAEFAIRVLYGGDYVGGASALRWLLPGIVLLGINTITMNYLASIGLPRVAIVAPVIGLLSNIALNLFLIPRHGIEGAAVASTISYGLMAVICGVWAVFHRERSPDEVVTYR